MESFKRVFLIACIILGCVVCAHGASTTWLTSPGGNESVDGGLRLLVDVYGAFGSDASPAGNAFFNPPGSIGAAGTTYESAVYLRGAGSNGFLAQGSIGSSGNLPSLNFTATASNSATSTFARGDLSFLLTQTIEDRFNATGTKVGSVLLQDYQVTNTGTMAADFSLTRYIDGDLYFQGDFRNDWGGASTLSQSMNQQLFEFDTGDNPAAPTTLVAIRSIGGVVPENHFEIAPYNGLLNKVITGGTLDNTVHGDGSDADLVTDGSYDISMAQQRNLSLSPGEVRTYTAITEFGQGTTAENPIDPIDLDDEIIERPYGRRAGQYGVEFNNQQELVATVVVHLAGDAATGPGGEDMAQIWENGIETAWSGQFEVVDGIHRYPIVLDIQYVDNDADADVTVTVHNNNGGARYGVNSLNFCTDDPSGWGFEYQGIVAAHEAGHWLGLWDEYNPMNDPDGPGPLTAQPAIWPLYSTDGSMLTDFWDLYDAEYGDPLDDWRTLSASADLTGLMGRNGAMRERYYANLLDWLREQSGRPDILLAFAPTFTYRDPAFDMPADADETPAAIPAPGALILSSIGICGLSRLRRARVLRG